MYPFAFQNSSNSFVIKIAAGDDALQWDDENVLDVLVVVDSPVQRICVIRRSVGIRNVLFVACESRCRSLPNIKFALVGVVEENDVNDVSVM